MKVITPEQLKKAYLDSSQVKEPMPIRIQRRRTKGWKMPPNTVFVGRPTRWGNPYKVGRDGTAAECVEKYKKLFLPYTHHPPTNGLDDFFISQSTIEAAQSELRGKNLACWCPLDQRCHADVLLHIANMKLI